MKSDRYYQPAAVIGAILYGITCAAGTLTWWVLGFFFLTSFFAFIYLIMNSGWRGLGTVLLALIPVVGALIALDRVLRKAWRLFLAGWFFYVYPLFTAFAPSGIRLGGALLGAILWWLFFTFARGVRTNPKNSFVIMWALPATSFFMIAAIVVPFVGAFADVDVDMPTDDFEDFAGGAEWNSANESFHETAVGGEPGLFESSQRLISGNPPLSQGAAGETGLFSSSVPATETQFNLQSHDSQLDSVDIGGSQDPLQVLSGTSDIEEIRIDPFTGAQHIETSDGVFSLGYSEVTGRLTGQSPSGSSLEIWSDQVTGEVHVSADSQITSFRYDSTGNAWTSVSEAGTTRVDTDPITGEVRIHSAEGVVKFRIDPFSNRILPS
jgi:hypothetical protein